MSAETKQVTIGDREFTVARLEPWKRLLFIADLQKDFLGPALKNLKAEGNDSPFGGDNNQLDVMSLVAGISGVLDARNLELWAKRITADGLIIYSREDGQRVKMSYSDFAKLFATPVDIINLLKEVITFNLEGVQELMSSFQSGNNSGASKIQATRIVSE